jgi:hypothetical protein
LGAEKVPCEIQNGDPPGRRWVSTNESQSRTSDKRFIENYNRPRDALFEVNMQEDWPTRPLNTAMTEPKSALLLV